MTHPDADPAESAVRSASRAEDAAYRAANDLGDQLEIDDYRLIGGQMVTLLVHAHRVDAPARATADADAGVRVPVAADPSFLPRFEQLGYRKQSGNRLARDDDVIDVLVPAATSRARSNRRHGDLVVDETLGLSFALARPPIPLRVAAELTDGSARAFTVSMPDPLAALVLKTFAWTARYAVNDVIDLHRCLLVARHVGITETDWPDHHEARRANTTLRTVFASPNRPTAVRALVVAVCGPLQPPTHAPFG